MNKKVSILITCFNEEEGLPMLYDALCGTKGICENLKEYDFEKNNIFLEEKNNIKKFKDSLLSLKKEIEELKKQLKH